MVGDIALYTAAGEVAGDDAQREDHLGARRPRAAALHPDQGGESAGLTRVARPS